MTNPPILPSMSVPMSAPPVAPPDATAVAPQIDPQPDLSYYEKLHQIYDDAVRLSHVKGSGSHPGRRGRVRPGYEFTKEEIDGFVRQVSSETFQGAHNFRTLDHLVRFIQNLDRTGKRPISEDDLSPLEKGAFARATLLGHGMTFGSSDELQGLLAMGAKFSRRVRGAEEPGAPGYGETYRNARDAQRRALTIARRSANGGLLNPELWGALASGTALGGGNLTAGLIRSGATGGGLSLFGSLADLPEQNLENYKANAVPIAVNTAIGTGMGVLPALIGKRIFAMRRPGDLRLAKALEAVGGEEGLGNAVRMSGTGAPMLSELQGTTFGRLGTEMRRASAEATAEALQRVQNELQVAQQAKEVAGRPWDELQTQIDDDRVRQILRARPLQKIMNRMVEEEAFVPGQKITGRVLEDIRQEIALEAKRLGRANRGGSAKRYRGWAMELKNIIDNSGEGMREARIAYGPFAERVTRLSEMERRLNIAARSSGIPVENKVTAHSEMLQEMGAEPWQRTQKAARQMVEPLYTPRTLDEHVARLLGRTRRFGPLETRMGGLMPWYMGLGSTGAALGGPTMRAVNPIQPGAMNPFFQQEPQQ